MGIPGSVLTQAVREIDELGVSQRIRKLTVTPQPRAVLFDFLTNAPTCPVVEVFNLLRQPTGELIFNPGDSVGVLFDFLDAALGNLFTEHHARVPDLDPDREFSYRITAGDGLRRAAVATGTFRTGHRTANVVFREIQIWNDGDPGLKGSGELSFHFGYYKNGDLAMEKDFSRQISSGEIVDLPFGTGPAFVDNQATDSVAVFVQGNEADGFISYPFSPNPLPDAAGHGEDDDHAWADAFQQLDLPNELGEYRLGFSLNSGPQEIFYVINGWIEGHVTNPPPMTVKSFTGSAFGTGTTVLGRLGSLQAVYPRGRRAHIFGLGPDGVIAQLLPREPHQRQRKWALIPTGGAETAIIIARDEYSADIVTVTDGKVRTAPCTLGIEMHEPPKWNLIGGDMQPALTGLRLADGTSVLIGLARTGEARATQLQGERRGAPRWAELGGRFVGRVAALATDEGIELFAVTSNGEVRNTLWRPDAKKHGRWQSLGGKSVTNVFVVADEKGTHLVVLTSERKLFTITRQKAGWPKRWQPAGTLDDTENDHQGT